ncbi:hypothetical protein CMO83_03430 [Candidatus Woesearchaeota archaeon]|jgi:hypothetical protein|nr:hypothetical protein [Candidatus Woesearchaeota archaeon]|tara:strand:+ start:11823 stop:13433 length:1611 start_codon:yes stop_codon:yes gene_type:complete
MKKSVILLLVIVLLISACEQIAKEEVSEEEIDHMIPSDYANIEQNIDFLVEAGNVIGSRHYDELEAAVNNLEKNGADVSELRNKLSKLNVAGRQGSDDEYIPPIKQSDPEQDDLDKRFEETKRMIRVISTEHDGMSAEEYQKLADELDEYEKKGLDIEDYRERLNSISIFGTEEHEAKLQKNFPKVKQGLLSPRGCEGNGSFLLGASPINIDNLQKIRPMGGMSTSHITPTDHQYWDTIESDGINDETTNLDRFDIIAPADGYIVNIEIGKDHRVVIEHSCDFYTIFIHVDLIKDHIWDQIKPEDGDITSHVWPRIKVEEGEAFGSIGVGKFDFSVVDSGVTLPGFLDLDKYNDWAPHTVDTFDYYKEPVRSQLISKNVRTAEPLGGKIDFDIDGKLIGNWFKSETVEYQGENEYVRNELALAYDSIDTDHVVVSIGDFGGNKVQYGVKGNEPDPADISVGQLVEYELVPSTPYVDGKKYDRSYFTTGIEVKNENEIRGVALFQLLENRKLKAEFFPDKKGSQVTGFTNNAVIYER